MPTNKVSLEDIYRILGDVKPEFCFWVNNGPILRNLQEMAEAIAYMKAETFQHHVNGEKNDFSNWIRDVLRDEELAKSIMNTASREKILRRIKDRITYLEKKIEKAHETD